MGCESSTTAVLDYYAAQRSKFVDTLTEQQIQIIKDTWTILKEDRVNNGCKIFMHMFNAAPEVKNSFSFRNLDGEKLFQNIVFRAHGENFMTLLNDVIIHIDTLERAALQRLIPLGHKHGTINAFDPAFLKVYKQSVMYTWESVLLDRYTAEIHEAWIDLLDFVIFNVADGYRAYEIEEAAKTSTGNVSLRMIEEYTR